MDAIMDNARDSLKIISEHGVRNGIQDNQDKPRCNIITVHGLKHVGGPEAEWPWQKPGAGHPTTDISAFLSLHDMRSRPLAFRYDIPSWNQGIDTPVVEALARRLLDCLAELVPKEKAAQPKEDFVFVGEDFGGLIIKEAESTDCGAVSLARWTKKYHFIAANTTVLVFFQTPHYIAPGKTSWESLASWLLSVSGWTCPSSVDWIRRTARMLHFVYDGFVVSRRLHQVIDVVAGPTAEVRWKETSKVGVSSRLVAVEQSQSWWNGVMGELCQKIKASSKPGLPFLRCLQMLATMSHGRLRNPVPLVLEGRASKKASDALEKRDELRKWNEGNSGSVHIVMQPGDDPSLLFSKLVATQDTAHNHDPAIDDVFPNDSDPGINYVFRSNGSTRDDAMVVLSSLCYQLLCLKPQLFEHASRVLDALEALDQGGIWPASKLLILFRSLLSCPHKGQTVCVLWEMPGTTLPRYIVDQLTVLAAQPTASFKLAIISSLESLLASDPDAVHLESKVADLESVLDDGLDAFLASRPKLQSVRLALRNGLLSQQNSRSDLFAGHRLTLGEVVRAWLQVITRLAVPVSADSLARSLPRMPSTIDGLYTKAVQTAHLSDTTWTSILSWLAFSLTPLDMAELATAFAVGDTITTLAELQDRKPLDLQKDLLVGLGDAVAVFDYRRPFHEEEFVRVLRPTAETPTKQTSANLCAEANLRLAKTCLQFLRLYAHAHFDVKELALSADSHPFLGYAVQYWPVHYASGTKETSMASKAAGFLSFFDDAPLVDFWARMHHRLRHPGVSTEHEHALSAAAEVGCVDLVRRLLKSQKLSQRLDEGLLAAIGRGDVAMATFLKESGATSSFALHAAASSGTLSLFPPSTTLSKANLDTPNQLGFLPLHCACQNGTPEIVDYLLGAGADGGAGSRDDALTPMHVAAMFGHKAILRQLADASITYIDATDKQGRTPLDCACEYQQADAVRVLVEKRDTSERLPYSSVRVAARTGRVDIVELLLGQLHSGTAPEDAVGELHAWQDENGCTPLHLAARSGHTAVVEALLQHRASKGHILVQDDDGNIPLHLSSGQGHKNVVEQLLQADSVEEQLVAVGDGHNEMRPIHLAVRHGHIDVADLLVKAHVQKQVSLDLFDEYPRSPLHYAALRGHASSTRLLVENQATVNIVDSNEATPLLYACRNGYDDVSVFLVEQRADVSLADSTGVTPLLAAAEAGSRAILETLLNAGGSWSDMDVKGRNALHFAMVSNSDETISLVLQSLAQAGNAVTSPLPTLEQSLADHGVLLLDKGNGDNTAIELAASGDLLVRILNAVTITVDQAMRDRMLAIATRAGHIGNVTHLVMELNASPEATDDNGRTALSWAAEEGHLAIVKFLAPRTPNVVDDESRTPLFWAARKGHVDVVKVLLAVPGHDEIATANWVGVTPLNAAIREDRFDVVKLLLARGADPNSHDRVGAFTPLHWAATFASADTMAFLAAVDGVDGEARDQYGHTPMFLAAQSGRVEAARQLIRAGWLANFPQGSSQEYPLHAAYDSPEVAELLITEAGMDVNARNKNGATVLHLAARDDPDTVRVLLKHGADPCLANCHGSTPLHEAAGSFQLSIAQMMTAQLTATSVDTLRDSRNNAGQNALEVAVAANNVPTVALFLDMPGGTSWVDETVIEAVIFQPNLALINLFRHHCPAALLAKTDGHGWSYAQIIDASGDDNDESRLSDGSAADDPMLPSAWDCSKDGVVVVAAATGQDGDGPDVRAKFETRSAFYDPDQVIVLANHPVPPRDRFYFTVRILAEVNHFVSIGVGRLGCLPDSMPGWEDDTWGLHSEDGGLYHAHGQSLASLEAWRYGTEDIVGVFVDTRARRVFYSVNGQVLDTGFEKVYGRVFPAVGLGPGCEVEVEFGSPDGQDPFKDVDGQDQASKVKTWI